MNKQIIISLFFIFSSGFINAQETKNEDLREDLHFGIRIGVNNSNVYDESGEEFIAEPKYGFAGGVFLSVPAGKFLGVRPELLISQKGFHATGKISGNKYDLNRTTTYLDIPLLIEFKPIRIFTFVAGPQYSYLIKKTDKVIHDDNASIQEEEFKNDNIRKNILSGALGFDLNINHFVFSARYNFDLQRNNGDGSSDTPKYKNIWLQATVGLRF